MKGYLRTTNSISGKIQIKERLKEFRNLSKMNLSLDVDRDDKTVKTVYALFVTKINGIDIPPIQISKKTYSADIIVSQNEMDSETEITSEIKDGYDIMRISNCAEDGFLVVITDKHVIVDNKIVLEFTIHKNRLAIWKNDGYYSSSGIKYIMEIDDRNENGLVTEYWEMM